MKRPLAKAAAFLVAAAVFTAMLPGSGMAESRWGDWIYTVSGMDATIIGYVGKGGEVAVPKAVAGWQVKLIGPSAFTGNTAVTAVSVPDCVTAIGAGSFGNCKGLKTVQLPAGVTVIEDDTFRGCTSLTDVEMPESLIGIGQYAFAGCTSLRTVNIPKWVLNISAHAFEGCTQMELACFYGAPPAISRTAFQGVAEGFKAGYHISQTGWAGYADHPTAVFCRMTLEPMSGGLPVEHIAVLEGGLPAAAPAEPARAGYQFAGWYSEAACLNPWESTSRAVYDDIVLYAAWKPLPRTIRFHSRGGSAVPPVTAPCGTLLAPPTEPTRAGYLFSGWFKEAECADEWDFYTNTVQTDTTLYACWATMAVPKAATAASHSHNSIDVHWEPVENASGYEVYRAAAAAGKYTPVGTVYAIALRDTGLDTGKQYFYKVRSFKQLETERIYSGDTKAVSARPTLAAPKSVKAGRMDTASIEITWGTVAGATMYEVWRSVTSANAFKRLATAEIPGHTDKKLAEGTVYYYRVRAYRLVGGKKVYGPYSAITSATP